LRLYPLIFFGGKSLFLSWMRCPQQVRNPQKTKDGNER
jgi:hypothetical protein